MNTSQKESQDMKSVLQRARWLLFFGCVVPFGLKAQEPLTLHQAIQLALKQSPDIDEARAGTQQAKAGADIARSQLFPQISFTEDMSSGNDPVYAFGTRLRQQRFTAADFALSSLNTPDRIGNFSTRLSGQWLVFDSFQMQKSIRSAHLMENSASLSAQAVDQKVVFNVVRSYQAVLYAERQVQIAQHELDTAEALLSSVDDHVKAGLAVESDRMSALVNVAARKQTLITAQGDLDLAWAQLRLATGSASITQTKLKAIDLHQFPTGTLEEELQSAAKNRKDLAALDRAQSSQAAAESAARLSYGPKVSAYGNWQEDRPNFARSGGNNWVVGAQISLDILPLGKRSQLASAKAAKARTDAQANSYQQQVRLQVNQAHIQRQTAQLSLDTARAAVDQATESLRILKNRYSAGLATITDLLRAEDAERQSQANYWHAVYGNTLSYAQLLFATGTLTPDAAEDLQ
jgi:outer membrane protein